MIYPAFIKLGNASGSTGIVSYGLCHNRGEAILNLARFREDYPGRPLLLKYFLRGWYFQNIHDG